MPGTFRLFRIVIVARVIAGCRSRGQLHEFLACQLNRPVRAAWAGRVCIPGVAVLLAHASSSGVAFPVAQWLHGVRLRAPSCGHSYGLGSRLTIFPINAFRQPLHRRLSRRTGADGFPHGHPDQALVTKARARLAVQVRGAGFADRPQPCNDRDEEQHNGQHGGHIQMERRMHHADRQHAYSAPVEI